MQNQAILTLDLHGKNSFQAKVAIDSTLKKAGGAYRIRLVHGYRHGDALKEMIQSQYAHHPQVLRLEAQGDGVTVLVLREL